jgi:uncharacterized repeat protein (TIGR01451 family)
MLLARSQFLASFTAAAAIVGFVAAASPTAHAAPRASSSADTGPTLLPSNVGGEKDGGGGEAEEGLEKLRDAYYWSPLLTHDASAVGSSQHPSTSGTPGTANLSSVGGVWQGGGPDPIVQVGRTTNTFQAVSGRIGALAIRHDGTLILGAAQGGVWTYDAGSGTWTPRLPASDTQTVGALAVAPSNDNVVYMGSGEAALSGDSQYGDGVYRSTDGGVTWKHVSQLFAGQSVSALAVDPTNWRHLYASTVRGRAGNHRTSAPTNAPYGVYESLDAGTTWALQKGTKNELHGATDLVIDPKNANHLFASFWGDRIYETNNAGSTWHSAMGDLPQGNFSQAGTRFSLGISNPPSASSPTLYTGFDYYDTGGQYHSAQVYKSTDNGVHWTATATGAGINSILGYCGTQCFYDNVVKPDPNDPNVVYVLGSYGYNFSPPSGGVFRSTDGGASWVNLGYDLHPDFHAIAFDPSDSSHIAIGNDGGVWQSHTGGGRNNPGDPLSASSWQDLNGQVDPNTAALIHSTGLTITQFSSMGTVPLVPGQYWGGTQDNGTLRKSLANNRWFDQASGDGGQVIVDQTTPNAINPTVPAYVFGTYFDISPYRYDPTETNTFFGNEGIDGGIDLSDRSEFYVPWVQNRGHVNQMFLGTYRLYRTDNAETTRAGDVTWQPISPDLTTGCTGAAPNGGRGCLISAIGVADGGDGAYVGTDEGLVQVSAHATTAASPTWVRRGAHILPKRPVNQFAVDRSNWRIAYVAYGGFNSNTTSYPGHVFGTTNGGKTWTDISGNLPDVPADSVVLDPADPNTLYVGTDAGPFVTHNGGDTWHAFGTGIPKVAVWQLDYDSTNAVIAAGTHGRGAYTISTGADTPALVASKDDSGAPVGPGSTVDYSITVRNIGNADAPNVRIVDPIPTNTNGVSIGDGGFFTRNATAEWDNLNIPAGQSATVHYGTRIRSSLPPSVHNIVDDGMVVTAVGQHVSTTGSPFYTAIAAPTAVSVSPTTDIEGGKDGQTATFIEHISNDGFRSDQYDVSTSGGSWSSTVYDASCTTPITTTPAIAGGDTTDVCVKVDVPGSAIEQDTNDTTLTVTSETDSAATASATMTSMAAQFDTLLVDNDTNDPVDSSPYYQDALNANGIDYGYWDLSENAVIPPTYLAAHQNVVWFTGNSYPGPLGGYESELTTFLNGGGRLFMSGQDVLDQAAGTTNFVHDYLHIDWDGTEVQNDKATSAVHSVTGNPVTDGIGDVPLDHGVLNAAFEDEVTPIDPASAAFTDDSSQDDALTVSADGYKVVFLAFPFEAYGSASNKADLINRAFTWFGA